MRIYGIIAEYNPFHLGHLYQINKIKESDSEAVIVALVSSCFTQRGDLSISDKWDRTKILLNNGIDLVIEFPFGYASQGSDIFARGAIEILGKLGIQYLVFGTESYDVKSLVDIANTQLNNSNYDKLVKKLLDSGVNYPTATSTAINTLLSRKINKPNDLLALSYVKEIIRQKLQITPISIKRTNNYHDLEGNNGILSGGAIRKMLREGKNVNNYVVDRSENYYVVNHDKYFNLLKYQIFNNIDNMNRFNTVDEGIDNRIRKVIIECNSWEELVKKIKTKRYTYNKINRMLIHILTGFTKEENKKIKIEYIRVLGFTIKGQEYLNSIKKKIKVPIITRYKKNISNLLDIEYRITCIYASVLDNCKEIIEKEWKNKPIIKK